jgi:hypothetical protein
MATSITTTVASRDLHAPILLSDEEIELVAGAGLGGGGRGVSHRPGGRWACWRRLSGGIRQGRRGHGGRRCNPRWHRDRSRLEKN